MNRRDIIVSKPQHQPRSQSHGSMSTADWWRLGLGLQPIEHSDGILLARLIQTWQNSDTLGKELYDFDRRSKTATVRAIGYSTGKDGVHSTTSSGCQCTPSERERMLLATFSFPRVPPWELAVPGGDRGSWGLSDHDVESRYWRTTL
ncbi:hypothetical protein CSOJ01_08650 [Colletotrichum sojae]|uniref:Uncharacterized protein n=1 Tax=Colletotrichum sojae TaxID=2175907 RepID=A0A8H6MRS5_9PEZI|nr:hypothetical protein CSOJ01_08650 [Colletotrichum sojae]